MRRFVAERIVAQFGVEQSRTLNDAAVLDSGGNRLAFTTDSFVVSPLFFPGGDIGTLAVHGTVNDLAVSGARPRWLSLGLILEEGLPLSLLDSVVESLGRAAAQCDVRIVTGDTKVVPRGAVDQIFINTAGIGELHPAAPAGPQALQPGDVLIVSGPVGSHGLAILCARESLGFDPPPQSDSAPLWSSISALLDAQIPVRCLRDCTRGGLAAVLHEWAAAASLSLHIEESAVPVVPVARGVAELLGLDPLIVACEGTYLAAVPREAAAQALQVLRSVSVSEIAAQIGEVRPRGPAAVTVTRGIGTERPFDEPSSSLLPRIC